MTPEEYNKRVLEELVAVRKNTEAILGMLRANGASGSPAANGRTSGGEKIADDRDLDGQYGNPTIKFDPKEKYWQGASYVGYKFSECAPEYLDATARYLDACAYMKRKDGDEKSAGYKEKDAARARGWATRNRNNPPAQQTGGGYVDQHTMPDPTGSYSNDDLPF